MILRFSLENHASFRELTEFEFVATVRGEEPSYRMPSRHSKYGVLPAVGIWGANASGKSNMIQALAMFQRAVRDSHVKWLANEPVPFFPWRLDRGRAPTRLQLDFVLGDIRYALGFAIDASGFCEEWLYRWETAYRQVLYHRNPAEDQEYYFGPSLKGQKRQIASSTRRNALFLSNAAQSNHPQLLPVYDFISSHIRFENRIQLAGYPIFAENSALLEEGNRSRVLAVLGAADFGVRGMRAEPIEAPAVSEEDMSKYFTSEGLQLMAASAPPTKRVMMKIILSHGADEESAWELPPEFESRGTHVLLARLDDLLKCLSSGCLLVVDELETSLHPDLCAELVSLFTDPVVNASGAQLLFSTHSPRLLEYLRSDEVLLIDKSYAGESSVRAASDFKGTTKNLRESHRRGRIGGTPVVGDLRSAMSLGK